MTPEKAFRARSRLRRPLLWLAIGVVAFSGACKKRRADVQAMLEDRGYHAIEIDSKDGELGVFHFKAKRSFEDCHGTVLLTDQKLISATCSGRSQVSSPESSPADGASKGQTGP